MCIRDRFWVIVAGLIWVFIKLPQEYWIHIAQLDVTDTIRDVPWFLPLITAVAVVLALVAWFVVRPRLDPADHAWQLRTPPMPAELATAAQRAEYAASHDRVWSTASLEKAGLVGLLSVIFSSLLPDLDVSPIRMIAWIAVFVLVNAALSIRRARLGKFSETLMPAFALRLVFNLGLLILVDRVFYDVLPLTEAIFFAVLFSVLVTAYDRYRPIYDHRFGAPARAGAAV